MCFGEVITAMLTPFKDDGSVNYEKAQELALYLLEHGSDGILVGGTTGENPALTADEMFTLFREVKSAVGKKGTVIGGAGSNNTAGVIEHIKRCNTLGLDGYLSVTPYYNKPTKAGLIKHFSAINAAAECPVMLYNVPGRTGLKMETDTVAALAGLENIKAIKESTGNVDDFSSLLLELPEDFAVYSGDDSITFPAVAMGAAGVVSVASHIVGDEIKEMIQCIKKGDIKRASELHLTLFPMFKGLFKESNPIPVKTAVNLLGFDVGGFRSPMCEASEDTVSFLKSLLKQYGREV